MRDSVILQKFQIRYRSSAHKNCSVSYTYTNTVLIKSLLVKYPGIGITVVTLKIQSSLYV